MAEPPNTPEADFSRDLSREDAAQLHDLLPFTIDERVFAVFTEQVDSTAEAKPVARLPRALGAIVGVVCVRGRMLTVLDAAAILNIGSKQWDRTLPYVLVLRGDEQLGLVAETCRDTITISAEDIEPSPDTESDNEPVVGNVMYGGEKLVILDATRLFSRAVERRERRRRRF